VVRSLRSALNIAAGDLGNSVTASALDTDIEALGGFGEGDTLTFRAVITDAAGNVTTGTASATTLTVDQTVPTLDPVSIAPATVGVGDTVTLSFTANEDIQTPSVTIGAGAGNEAGGPTVWTATRDATGTDTEGVLTFSIDFTDLAGNAGTTVNATTDPSQTEFTRLFRWNGGTDTAWSNGANWQGGAAPNNAPYDVEIDTAATTEPILDGEETIRNLTIEANRTLSTAGNSLTVSNTFANSGTLRLTGTEGAGNVDINAPATVPGTVEYYGGAAGTLYATLGSATAYTDLLITNTAGLTEDAAFTAATTEIDVGAGNDLTLNASANDFGTLTVTSGRNITLEDSGAIEIAGATVSGAFSVTSAGNITDSGVISVTGDATFNSGGNDVTFDVGGHDFNRLSLTGGGTADITEGDAVILSGVTLATLTLTAGGAIQDDETIGTNSVSGTATFDAGGNGITLDDDGDATYSSDYGTIVLNGGGNAFVGDINGIDLGGTDVALTNLTVIAGGTITDSGAVGASVADLSADGGITLDAGHSVGTFAASNTTGGAIRFDNTAAPLTITGVTQVAGGTVDINNIGEVALNGDIDDGGGGAITQIDIDTGGADAITDGGGVLRAGTINLQTTAGSSGAVGTIADRIETAGATTLGLGEGTNLANAYINHAGALTVGTVSGAGGATIDVISSGAINGNADDGTADIVGDTVNLTATAGGIGTTTPIDIAATTALNADTTGDDGNIFLDSIGGLSVELVDAGNGNVTLDSTGAIDGVTNDGTADVNGAAVSLTAAAGGIGQGTPIEVTGSTSVSADTTTDNGNISIDAIGAFRAALVNAGTGTVTINATTSIEGVTDDGVADIVGDTITLLATLGGIGQNVIPDVSAASAFSADTTADNGAVTVDSIGALPVALIDAGAGGGTVVIDATGAITDSSGDAAADIEGGTLTLTAGAAIDIDTDITTLAAATTAAAGALTIEETDTASGDGLTVTTFDATAGGGGAVSITAALNDLTVNGWTVPTNNDLTLESTNGTLTYPDAAIDVGLGTLTLTGGTDVARNGGGNHSVTAATFDLTSGGPETVTTNVGTLNVTLTGAGHLLDVTENDGDGSGGVTIGSVQTNNGTVTIDSTAGWIRTASDDGTADITGGNGGIVLVAAAGGIGQAGAALDVALTAGTLQADTVTGDDSAIVIDVIGDVTVELVDAGTGDVTLDATGALEGNTDDGTADIAGNVVALTAQGGGIGATTVLDVDSDTGGTGRLDADASATPGNVQIDEVTGNLTVGLVTAGTANVTLDSVGAINGNANDGTADIMGATVNLTAASGGIGTGTIPEVTATTALNADTAADNANIAIESIGALPLGLVTTGGGAGTQITLTGDGTVNDATANTVADLIAETISATGFGGEFGGTEAIETQATDITITTAGGVIDIDNDSATAVTVNGLTTDSAATPAIAFDQTGGGDLTISGGVATTSGGSIGITATAGLTVDALIDTSGGTGGVLSVTNAIVNVQPTLGSGSITVTGGGPDTTVNVATVVDGPVSISADRDIIIQAPLEATGGTADVTLTADADTNGTGGVQIQTAGSVTAGRNIEIQGSDLNANAGRHVEVQADGAANQIQAGGSVTIQPRDAGQATSAELTIDGRIQAVTGVTITANGNVIFGAAGDIVPSAAGNTNSVIVTADNAAGDNGNVVTMDDATLIDAGNGEITINADGAITLGGLSTSNGGGAAIALTSTGADIVDGGDALVDIDADAAGAVTTISSATGVGQAAGGGATPALETTIAALDITNGTSGAVRIVETNALTINAISNTTAGLIDVAAGGAVTVAAGGGGVVTGGADPVSITATGATSTLAVNDAVQSAGGIITLEADDDVSFGVDGDVISGGGAVNLTADLDDGGAASGALTMAAGTVVNAGGGVITVISDGDATLGQLTSTFAAGAAISVTSREGSILEAGDAGAELSANAAGAHVLLSAEVRIGATAAVDATVALPGTALDADVVDLRTAGNATDAAINITSTGGAAVQLNHGSGAASSFLVQSDQSLTVDAWTVDAGDGVGLLLTGAPGTALITVPDAPINTGATGTIRIDAAADGQDIADAGDSDLSNNLWTADTIILRSGTGESILTTAGDLTAIISDTTGGAGSGFTVTETDAITLTDVTTANGPITVTAGGAITATLVDASATDDDANDITIATTVGNIEVDTITTGGTAGDVTRSRCKGVLVQRSIG